MDFNNVITFDFSNLFSRFFFSPSTSNFFNFKALFFSDLFLLKIGLESVSKSLLNFYLVDAD